MTGFTAEKRTTHHEMSNRAQDRQEIKVTKFKVVLKELNPFSYDGMDLVNVVIRQEHCGDDA